MSTTVGQPFAWSYSVLKNFETCALRYYSYNVAKNVIEPETEQLKEGNRLHKVFENRLKGEPLPLGFAHHEALLASILNAPGVTYAEQKLAMTSSFTPSGYFGKGVWFRTVIDCTKVRETSATVLDWKTGKVSEDETQLKLMAATLFCHMPAVQRIKAALVFVNYDHAERAEYVREDLTEIWGEILPRVKLVERARQAQHYPPTPSGLCKKYCAVTSCPHHGR